MAHEPPRRPNAHAAGMDVGRSALAQAQAARPTGALGLGAEPLDRFTVCHARDGIGLCARESVRTSHARELPPPCRHRTASSGRRNTLRRPCARRAGLFHVQRPDCEHALASVSVRSAQSHRRTMASALLRAFVTAALLLTGAAAYADDRLWILTGEVYQSDYYFGGGLLIPFWGNNHLGQGWVQRYWLDTFSYTYDANGRDIDANVFGADAMIGYQASRPGLSGAVYLGVRYSNAHLSPDDPGGAL